MLSVSGAFNFRPSNIAAAVGPLLLYVAAVLVFVRPRLGYTVALVACVLFLAWPLIVERVMFENAWTVFNENIERLGVQDPDRILRMAKLQIISVALVSAAATGALLRWMPFRGIPGANTVAQSIWPAFAGSLLCVGTWFAFTAAPYRVPLIVDSGPCELRILHIQKHGLSFRETAVVLSQDGRYFSSVADRRLFEYEIRQAVGRGLMPAATRERVSRLAQSTALWAMHTRPIHILGSWNAEAWYVVVKDARLVTFASEDPKSQMQDVKELFFEVQSLPLPERGLRSICDVCLGLCYGPAAALGFVYSNQPCFALAYGKSDCG